MTALETLAAEFVRYWTTDRTPDGCGMCGGIPHSTTCYVGRMAALIGSATVSAQRSELLNGQERSEKENSQSVSLLSEALQTEQTPLLDWQAIRFGDSVETRLALAYYRVRGWSVDDQSKENVDDRIYAFQTGYRAAQAQENKDHTRPSNLTPGGRDADQAAVNEDLRSWAARNVPTLAEIVAYQPGETQPAVGPLRGAITSDREVDRGLVPRPQVDRPSDSPATRSEQGDGSGH